MLIREDLLKIDEAVEDIIAIGDDLTAYYADIDSEIISACFDVGVPQADIPLDGEGYVVSQRLQRLGKFYGLFRINKGYCGIGNGDNEDIYSDWVDYKVDYETELAKLTKESITEGAPTDTPTFEHNVRQTPFII